jgi:acyl-ACP thioesterase
MTLDKALMPVLDGHPDVFDREWPLRVADIDRDGRLRLDAAARHIQDIGQDHVHALGFDESHPLWVVPHRDRPDPPDRIPGHTTAAPLVLGNLHPVV